MSEYDAWAAVYDDWATDMTEDVPHYVELAREADGPLVELAVGSGRVAIAVARATGKRVIGIDSSSAMLALARERAGDLPLDLRLGDMRELELEENIRRKDLVWPEEVRAVRDLYRMRQARARGGTVLTKK